MSKKEFKKQTSALFNSEAEKVPQFQDSKRKGTKPNELRHTFLIREESLAKLKEIAKRRDVCLKSIVNQALELFIENWEGSHGELKHIAYEGKKQREARIAKEMEKIKEELL